MKFASLELGRETLSAAEKVFVYEVAVNAKSLRLRVSAPSSIAPRRCCSDGKENVDLVGAIFDRSQGKLCALDIR